MTEPKLNPIHKYKGVWHFWTPKGKRIGSYVSEVGAEKGLEDYIKEEEEKKNGNKK